MRNKKGMKLIATMKGDETKSSRIQDISTLKLPEKWFDEINQIINDHSDLYDVWVETANDYNELRKRLVERGYSNIPQGASPLLHSPIGNFKAETKKCLSKKTMLRKRKDV